MLPPDNHVHTRWSWDTSNSSTMQLACERAASRGLPGLAFTEHVDFTAWGEGDGAREGLAAPDAVAVRPHVMPFDVEGYSAELERVRGMFPQLRIVSGIEAGEPHLFAGSVSRVLASGSFERVLGSLHSVSYEGRLVGADDRMFRALGAEGLMRKYFTEMLDLVSGSSVFGVLAHCDFPRRYWPERAGEYDESRFEEEYRAVFRALAASGRALEINTRSPLWSVDLVRWWREEGGRAVSFGSDAHQPYRVGALFDVAVDIVEAAGFKAGRDPLDFWYR
ncbi:PHP domain-containing protein [Spongisporangium articulatum]|uniref:Histidinol-phosphatase n=1 Tax=Spongisporangium articulatum TaxID=3362603 RepID=A0ABW8ASA1_9ACTN